MRINVYNSEFHALQSSGIQFSLPPNKTDKKLATTNTTNTNAEPCYLLALHF